MTQNKPEQPALGDPGSRSTEFEAVEGGQQTTSAEALLITAYVAMWAILLGFVLLSWRRQSRVERRISELETALAAGDPKTSAN